MPGRVLRPVVVRADRVVDERGLHDAVARAGARRDGVGAPRAARDDRRRARPGRRAPRGRRGARRRARARTRAVSPPRARRAARSWSSSAAPVNAGSVPGGARARRRGRGRPSAAAAPTRVQRPPRRARAHLRLERARRAPSAGRRGRSGAARAARASCASRRRQRARRRLVGEVEREAAPGGGARRGSAVSGAGCGGGAEAEGLAAGELSERHDHGPNTASGPKRSRVRCAVNQFLREHSGQEPRSTTSCVADLVAEPLADAVDQRSSSSSSNASIFPQRSQIAWWWCSPLGCGGLVGRRCRRRRRGA